MVHFPKRASLADAHAALLLAASVSPLLSQTQLVAVALYVLHTMRVLLQECEGTIHVDACPTLFQRTVRQDDGILTLLDLEYTSILGLQHEQRLQLGGQGGGVCTVPPLEACVAIVLVTCPAHSLVIGISTLLIYHMLVVQPRTPCFLHGCVCDVGDWHCTLS